MMQVGTRGYVLSTYFIIIEAITIVITRLTID